MSKGGGSEQTTGYKYYFSILAGICRGPVDSLFLIKADGKVFYDVEIKENTTVNIYAPDLFGGDKGQGGLFGNMDAFFGRFDQIIPLTAGIRVVMEGLRVSQLRGVLATFYTGEVTANDPYPKAWSYRVRRVLKGWYKDECWYPEKALIQLTDPSIPVSAYGPLGGYTTASSTTLVDADGNATSDPTAAISTVTTTYQQQTVTTYTTGTGTSTAYNVPQFYNDIQAMNPAHIIYECVTNPDWGRGLPRELVDNVSFASAANVLFDEGFGLCMKWSQQEDIDAFVQNVIDHIGAAVYTNPITGLLSIRLLRNDYDVNGLSEFDYDHGLLEVNSYQTAASDATANEVIIKYHSPVMDSDREARAQNIALQNSLGSFFTVTKDYSGIPTSTLALKVAARELRINSGGWKRVEFKVDRRGYTIVPGDVIKITAPDRGINQMIVRVATIDHSQIKDGTITIVGTHDIYGLPLHATQEAQQSTFQEVNRYPLPPLAQNISIGTYRDTVKFGSSTVRGNNAAIEQQGGVLLPERTGTDAWGIGQAFLTVQAQKPSAASITYETYVKRATVSPDAFDADVLHDWKIVNTLNFQRMSRLTSSIGVGDTTFEISGEVLPSGAVIGGCYMICDDSFAFFAAGNEEFVRLDAISQNTTTGKVTVTVARGCVDTPAIPHTKNSRFWAYDESGGAVGEVFGWYDNVFVKCLTRTSLGLLDPARAQEMSIIPDSRAYKPYSGAGFKVNGYVRDQVPPQTGDLVCTWHHRNRVTQEDHLIGEDEANVTPEDGTVYGVVVYYTTASGSNFTTHWSLPAVYTGGDVGATGTTSDTITIDAAELVTEGCVTGPMTLVFYTGRGTPDPLADAEPTNYWSAANSVSSQFQYIVGSVTVDTDTSGGFNFEFDNNFTGG